MNARQIFPLKQGYCNLMHLFGIVCLVVILVTAVAVIDEMFGQKALIFAPMGFGLVLFLGVIIFEDLLVPALLIYLFCLGPMILGTGLYALSGGLRNDGE